MRKTNTIFSLLMVFAITGAVSEVGAQERRRGDDNRSRNQTDGRDRDGKDNDRKAWNDRNEHDNKRNHQYSYDDHRDSRHGHRGNYHHSHRSTVVRHVHYHDRYCGHRTITHHHQRPRYVYYRDYDVYYDLNRSVYVSYSGRSWSMSSVVPVSMRNVNVRTTRSYTVDYWDDDMPGYLEKGRPSCGDEYRGW